MVIQLQADKHVVGRSVSRAVHPWRRTSTLTGHIVWLRLATLVRRPAMRPSGHEQTLFVPKHRGPSIVDRATTGLPPDLLGRLATRLQVLAWLYAFTFFMAAFFVRLLLRKLPARGSIG